MMMNRHLATLAAVAALATSAARADNRIDTSPQTVEFAVTDQGAGLSLARVKVGQRVRLVVTRKTESTCIRQLVNRELGIDSPLPLNRPVTIEVTPRRPGAYHIVCGMGMDVVTLKAQ